MQFFLIMFFVYFVATAYWIHLMRKHSDNKVSIHYYFGTLIFCTMVECAITFAEYDVYNQTGKRMLPLTIFSVLFSAFRATLARLICLLISLGYGIVMNVLNRYRSKVFLLTFLYFIAASINRAAFYINQHKPLSKSVKIMLYVPQGLLEVVFLIWTISALIRTLSYLKMKR